jgi:hypothetical protein
MTGGTITASADATAQTNFKQYWQPVGYPGFQDGKTLVTHMSDIASQPLYFPFQVGGNLTANEVHYTMSKVGAASVNFVMHVGIYTYANSSSINLISSHSTEYSIGDTATVSGIRAYEMDLPKTTFAPGDYVMGIMWSASNTNSMNFSIMGGNTASAARGTLILPGTNSYATHVSHAVVPFWGRNSVTTGALPTAVAMSNMIQQGTGTNLMAPVHFDLCNHV